jgi:glycosyltransferase involved in cell wall biosynthesis
MSLPILIIGNFLSGSGGSRCVCEEMAARFSALGWPVTTASEKRPRLQRLLDMLATVWMHHNDYAVAQIDLYSGPAFVWAEAVCASLRLLRKPYILTLHGGNLPAFSKRHPMRVKHLLHSAAAVTAPSHYLFEQMKPYRTDMILLPNALDVGKYEFRLRSSATPRLVWLRAMHEIYNPEMAPKVLRMLGFSHGELLMIGPDKSDGSLARVKIASQGLNVRLIGQVAKSEVPTWLNRGDIFLNTTNVDNTPVSVLEAMACGLCVVSTNAGGLPYFIKNGEDGFLTPVNDPAAMAGSVRRILTSPELAMRLSQAGRAKAEKHDWSVILPQWTALFNSVSRPQMATTLSPCQPVTRS